MDSERAQNSAELRWPALLAVLVIITLQLLLPAQLSFVNLKILCLIELAIALIIFFANPTRITEHKNHVWLLGITLNALMSVINVWTLLRLIDLLINQIFTDPIHVLFSGGNIWISNVIIFSLWYWEFDSGGAGKRATGKKALPDFMFAQTENPHLAPAGWRPHYVDYLYFSLTNASAFSPADGLPLARSAKLLMPLQSMTSLFTVILVIARAINTLH